jgi:hypothetical protein
MSLCCSLRQADNKGLGEKGGTYHLKDLQST